MNQIKLLSSVDGDAVTRSFINLELKNPGNTGGLCALALPTFCNHLFFYNHFEEQQTVFIEVELLN